MPLTVIMEITLLAIGVLRSPFGEDSFHNRVLFTLLMTTGDVWHFAYPPPRSYSTHLKDSSASIFYIF